jgi:hypothetical protein
MKSIQNLPFLCSVFGGILVWFIMFFLFPAKIVSPIATETILYVLLNYTALVVGYFIFPERKDKRFFFPLEISVKFIYAIVGITIASFFIRYIDLFLFRKVSFLRDVWDNRSLLLKTKPNFIFIIASIGTHFYFMPIIFVLKQKVKSKKLYIISIVLFLFPFIEGCIRGGRSAFFTPAVLLLIIFILFKKNIFTKQNLILVLSIAAILFTIATSIIKKREASKTNDNFRSITTDFALNDFLKPKREVFIVMHSIKNQTLKEVLISGFQIQQYYVHGVFEFDNLIKHYQKVGLKPQYGKFTFLIINKFTNKYNLTNTDLDKVKLMNPRSYIFITFFGGLYLDFGWLGTFIMLLYGSFQKYIAKNVYRNKNQYIPLFILLLYINFFMLTFNFLRNTGTSMLLVCFTLIFTTFLWNKIRTKKS